MLQQTELPAVERYPRAVVESAGERILIAFRGDDGAREVEVDRRHVGEVEDLEQTELQLLARLQEIGYDVEWRRGVEGEQEAEADSEREAE